MAREEHQLDAHGNALITINANGHATTRSFDAFDRVETETLGGVTVTQGTTPAVARSAAALLLAARLQSLPNTASECSRIEHP